MGRKLSWKLTSLGVGVCSLLAAWPLQAGAATPRAVTTLTVWARSDESSFIGNMITGFNKTHTNIQAKLTIVPAGNAFTQKFGAALASGTGPDVVSINLVYVPYFASVGQLTDLTQLASTLPYRSQLNASELRLGTWQNKLYALPFTGDASVLFYNTDLFKAAGLNPNAPPTTWSQMEADARKITALGHGNYGYYFPGNSPGWNLFTFTPYIWASGGDVLQGEGTAQKATIASSPQVAAALRFYNRLWADKVIPSSAKTDDGTQILSLFEAGHIGMLPNGSFAFSELTTKYPNLHFGITPIPGQNGGSASFAGGDNIAIPRGTHHPQEAWTFLQWATSKQTQFEDLAKIGVVPARGDALPAQYSSQNPLFAKLVKAMAQGRTPKSVVYSQLFEDPTGPWINMIQKGVFTGDIAGATALGQKGFTSILAQQ